MVNYNVKKNFTLLVDFYELTMANGFFQEEMRNKIVIFDMFFREVPDNGQYTIVAGLEQLIEYMENLHFSEEDIEFLREKNIFVEEFLDYLRDFKFECDVWAMPEGTLAFPEEPLLTVKGPAIQAQMLETMVLLTINHQSMIATKASRIVRQAKGRPVVEFGSRRAQGYSAANLGARAAYIGGCAGTANTLSDKMFGVPALGTMAHSWVQMFDTELEAFRAFARVYPDNCLLLVDTYDTLKEGVPNAIKIFDEEVVPRGFRPKGIRIDSGDITYISNKARKMLDDAGYPDAQIMASNSLDEFTIRNILHQGAKIDSFGVGERLITSKSSPVFGGVYKLAATVNDDGEIIPKIKISENVTKITTPGFKELYRFYDKESKKAMADVIALREEEIPENNYEIFHPVYTWKRKTLENYDVKKVLVQIYEKGELVYNLPSLEEIKQKAEMELDTLWSETKRLDNPNEYIVDLSEKLWEVKSTLLKKHGKN
ncbi:MULTISPECIES: nicotinate phosphoribosyltransferase [Peptoniphilus]|jgi:putative nicotinate phosphoribosyltransferase|uniref:nicotinate phosphoribosyltransferase n=1 Tax=Peptoniphilus TaxID=162289 RepID=UPI002355C4E9|nr:MULTISPECIES: nicotinate phosphoribosyltransferase [Peptoniphilus]MBS6611055.1 nicotinate phosphoribosyltransferase [Peptoniphilus harei]MDU1044123.1 nicotinate phosphoribosyltransferase [Peptoniphilus rhinitidis]MDU2114985.1 nicotinate phosphoribosyltransferase [Peptoniphilus lacydonensis]MDU3750604.1 nicotinate phosphoribosyltransferase [Peptoniphilus rhinitidis]MDU5377577.1 nicotinate phosphoribosyltransferase [Peptoniphilus lacydonensis]